ncbi:MFS transporter [Dyella mobilis]|uniref:MFS transporter n=1 Tax=Dyella mobilis TaxID=1849582 RepID=A0ABS2KCH7_9GAMM|nr:MFS transporter [Dyella mobilis]MBM7128867.1 MFS transporter [Dyella mobilis]GLQ99198.1 nitrate transporter [Dyella mobilis]
MSNKATRIELFRLRTPQMRAFHLSWLACFACFLAWFAVAPLMPLIKDEFHLDQRQLADIGMAAVAVTVFGRLIVGPLCDRFGPRRTYTGLLVVGAIPVFGIAFAHSYESFVFFRLAIGIVGAGFVITQYHTSVMFAPNVVGTANATVAGWGNAGGGAAQWLVPGLLAGMLALGVRHELGWRVATCAPGVLMLIVAILYARHTQDCPEGDYRVLRARGNAGTHSKRGGWKAVARAIRNYRVWMLFVAYAGCFGIELFVHGVAVSYYIDRFGMDLFHAGLAAGCFGLLASLARPFGGIASDRLARKRGLRARSWLLGAFMLGEGIGLLWFSGAQSAGIAVTAMIVFGLFTHLACGATYALVPFIDRQAIGGVAGIVGAGGNVGALAAGLMLRGTGSVPYVFALLGCFVIAGALCALAVRFSAEHVAREERLYREALLQAEPPPSAAWAID